MGRLTFITGPVRSGKSRHAVEAARPWGDEVVYVATYQVDPTDGEMADRVARHRGERPPWRTLEAPEDVAHALETLHPPPSGVLMDCLTLWASARLAWQDEALMAAWEVQVAAFRAFPWPTIIVGNEIGWSPVPEDPLLRRYRDVVGWLAQRTAAAADDVILCVAGIPLHLKG